jgi:Domain of unknown function (DUF4190)/Domain of unknown function (DUF1707)
VTVDPAFDGTFNRPGGNGTIAGPPGMLAANADRERAIDILRAGFAEGRLTKAEHDSRAARVYAARTYGELGALVADLPAGPVGVPAHYRYPPPPVALPPINSMAVASLVCGIGEFFTLGLTAIPAIVLGHAARRQIRQTRERGDGMAVAGLVFGWAGVGLIALVLLGLFLVVSVSARTGHSVVVGPVPGPAGPGQGG